MNIGLNIEKNLKTLFNKISSFEYLNLEDENIDLNILDLIIIDSKCEKLEEHLYEYKRYGVPVIALVGKNDISEMRRLFLSCLIDDCIIRQDILSIKESIERIISQHRYNSFYLSDTFKKGIYKFSEIIYITYSSITRKTEFHLINSNTFKIKKSFFHVEESLKNIANFYKLDRGTIVNLNLIQVLDFKEEQIIFKNTTYIYTSKNKLKELESKLLQIKNKTFLKL